MENPTKFRQKYQQKDAQPVRQHFSSRGYKWRRSVAVLLGVVMFLSRADVAQACPSECVCSSTTVECTNQLSQPPSEIPTGTTILDLNNNNIATLNADAFAGLTSLQKLYIDSNGMVTVDVGAFNGLTSLQELTLESNSIVTLPDNLFGPMSSTLTKISLASNSLSTTSATTFSGLSALETLELNDNALTTLPADVFSDLSALLSLDLSGNQITTISSGAFNGLTSLPLIDLDNNDINDIAAGVLAPMTSLEKFSAVGNALTTVPSGVFVDHSALLTIDLQDNRIGDLDSSMFTDLAAIRVIKLRSNQITSVGGTGPSNAFFAIKDSIREIDLSNNQLTAIAQYQFVAMTSLETLDLSENLITSVDQGFYECRALQTLNLKNNQITSIATSAFDLQSLIELDISHNQLSAVPTSAFELVLSSVSLLETLYLNDNQITSVEADAFTHCSNIRVIVLKRNTLNTLVPLAFSGLEQLRSVDLSINDLTSIPADAFLDLQRLQSVDLTVNSLETVLTGAFKNLDNFQQLDLSSNVIHTVETGAFDTVPMLATLNLNINRLTAIPKSALETVTSLVTLDLSVNQISGLSEAKQFGDLTNLQTLHLYNNSIATVIGDCLDGLSGIQNITLYDNSITDIPGGLSSTTSLSQLVSINLERNSISSISADAFTGFTALETLRLYQNLLTTLPSGTLEPCKTTLSDLRLGENDLLCDCNIEWLVANFGSAITSGSCSTPAELSGRVLSGTNAVTSTEVCPPTTTTTTTTVTTTVIEPVVIVTLSHEVNVKIGNQAVLLCEATGIPAPTIVWMTPLGGVVFSTGQYNVDATSGTLTITGITENMAGYYVCTASNALGDTASINVRVWVLFAPYITNFIEAAVISDTVDCFMLPCDVNAYPAAAFTWEVPKVSSSVSEINTGDVIMTSTGTLYSSDLSEASTGYYNCTATNSEGSVWREAFTFIYNGTENADPISVSAAEGSSVVLDGSAIYSTTGFVWSLPSGDMIMTSERLRTEASDGSEGGDSTNGNGDETATTESTTASAVTNTDSSNGNTGSDNGGTGETAALSTAYRSPVGALTYTSVSLAQAFTVNISTGSLRIESVTAYVNGDNSISGVGATIGTFLLLTARGSLTFNVVIDTNATTVSAINTTTASNVTGDPLTGELSTTSIYYITLSAVIASIIFVFVSCIYIFRKGKKKKHEQDALPPPVVIDKY